MASNPGDVFQGFILEVMATLILSYKFIHGESVNVRVLKQDFIWPNLFLRYSVLLETKSKSGATRARHLKPMPGPMPGASSRSSAQHPFPLNTVAGPARVFVQAGARAVL